MSPLLLVDDVHVRIGQSHILHGVSLAVGEGESVGLIGPNGHGKTTLLRTISGLHRVASGSLAFLGERISSWSPQRIAEAGLVHVPQGSKLFPELTVRENLRMGSRSGRARPQRAKSEEFVYDLFPRLRERRAQFCGTLSGGERQMLAIGMGLMAVPRVLMLDEPTLGLAPKVRRELAAAVSTVRESGLALVVVDGDVDFVFDLTDKYVVLETGRLVGSGTSAERPDDEAVMQMYFGGQRG